MTAVSERSGTHGCAWTFRSSLRMLMTCLAGLWVAGCGGDRPAGPDAGGAAQPRGTGGVAEGGALPDEQAAAGWTVEPAAHTRAQAERGEGIFRAACANCHIPPFFTGLEFRSAWAGNTVGELYRFVRTSMPQDAPGRLEPEEYADVLAFILELNGVVPGAEELGVEFSELNQYRIQLPR